MCLITEGLGGERQSLVGDLSCLDRWSSLLLAVLDSKTWRSFSASSVKCRWPLGKVSFTFLSTTESNQWLLRAHVPTAVLKLQKHVVINYYYCIVYKLFKNIYYLRVATTLVPPFPPPNQYILKRAQLDLSPRSPFYLTLHLLYSSSRSIHVSVQCNINQLTQLI